MTTPPIDAASLDRLIADYRKRGSPPAPYRAQFIDALIAERDRLGGIANTQAYDLAAALTADTKPQASICDGVDSTVPITPMDPEERMQRAVKAFGEQLQDDLSRRADDYRYSENGTAQLIRDLEADRQRLMRENAEISEIAAGAHRERDAAQIPICDEIDCTAPIIGCVGHDCPECVAGRAEVEHLKRELAAAKAAFAAHVANDTTSMLGCIKGRNDLIDKLEAELAESRANHEAVEALLDDCCRERDAALDALTAAAHAPAVAPGSDPTQRTRRRPAIPHRP